MIPQAAPQRRIARFKAEVDAAIAAVVASDTYILGEAVGSFETAFAAYAGVSYAVGVASGTDALALALRALDIGPGDEVITPALTFVGTAQAILQTGATPRFVDVDPITRCIDVSAAADAVNEHTAALLPVHLFGYPCDMPQLMALAERHGLAVVEDCAQAHGAMLNGRSLGSFGHAAAFSFYPTKNLGAVGDGGAVLTSDAALRDRLLRFRNYGFKDKDRISHSIGFNSRLDEIQAAILMAMLPHLEECNIGRRAIAAHYHRLLNGSAFGLPVDHPGCVYHQFAITHHDRDRLREHFARVGIGTAIHYTPGLHQHPIFSRGIRQRLPVTEALAASLISLPIQPEVAADVFEDVARAAWDFLQQ